MLEMTRRSTTKTEVHKQQSSGGIRSSKEEKEEILEAAIAGVGCVEMACQDSGVIKMEASFNGTACLVSKERGR